MSLSHLREMLEAMLRHVEDIEAWAFDLAFTSRTRFIRAWHQQRYRELYAQCMEIRTKICDNRHLSGTNKMSLIVLTDGYWDMYEAWYNGQYPAERAPSVC